MSSPGSGFGPRLDEAFVFASKLHRNQLRKGSRVPYLTHLMAVAAIVGENGGDEDLVIAGLLHDAVEDQGGKPIADEIRRRFGDRVADVVEGCTEPIGNPKPPWKFRRQAYLERLKTVSDDVLRVSLADKLHNARCLWNDLQTQGESTWGKFNAPRDEVIWFYTSLATRYASRCESVIVAEFRELVEKIARAACHEAPA